MQSAFVQKLAELDQQTSYLLFKYVPKTKRWRSALKGFEYSCHGLIWIFGLTALVFTFPEYVGFVYLLGGLLIDVFYVAIVKALARRRRPSYSNQQDQMFMVLSDKFRYVQNE